MSVLETQKLTRAYGSFLAVDALDLAVEAGEIFGLLGTNGAGKSTAIKMLTTLLDPTSGEATLGGFNLRKQPNEIRKIIGYVPQMLSVDGALSGRENLMLFAKLYDIPWRECGKRVDEALDFMGLQEAADKRVKTFSGGMIRRLEIAQSMMHHPKVLFLDEPTVGLDPMARKTVWAHIVELKNHYGTTIFLTTHLMDEADRLCDRLGFISRGKLVALDSPENLKATLQVIGKEDVTLEDVFIHYTADTLSASAAKNYREISRERKTAKRMG
jgi:ABC-2 type transport system ATP-binding protein